uniref:Tetratricopeptide repeat domain 12 n=1 Tax=Sinocyclocheilus grahami TaxID=75366 RepID=A0A672SBH1_SINGR
SDVSCQEKAISMVDQFISSLEPPVQYLQEQGNEAFTQGDYETAVQLYTEGLDQLCDMQALYTNRAYIKLKRYKEAISDCEWALRCNEKCIKAYVHMGKSHLALKDFKQVSFVQWKSFSEMEPQRETMVKGMIQKLDLEKKASLQEKTAWEELQEGTDQAMAVPELLKKLDRPDEINLYYCGGLELLSQAIKDCNFSSSVFSCLSQNSKDPYAVDLCMSVVKLWRTVCSGNEQNQQLLMECPSTRQHMVQLLASPVREIQRESLELLSMYSQIQHGRDMLIDNLNLTQYVFLCHIECIALYHFPQTLKLQKDMNLISGTVKIKLCFGCRSCECRSVLYPLLGLMINLASNPSQVVQVKQEYNTVGSGPALIGNIKHFCSQRALDRQNSIAVVGGEMSSRYSIKALTVCTASIPQACEEMVKLDKRLRTLRKLLGGIDELVVGNAALCMGHCLEVDGAAGGLLGTDCVQLLLHHAARNAKRAAVRQNATITLGKLCKIEPRHMEKLGELHGLEILHSCVRLIT